GEAFAAAGLRIGYLPQEPQLDPAKDVRGNVEEVVAEVRALPTRFEEVSAKPGGRIEADGLEKLLDEQAGLQDRIDALNAWELGRGHGIPWEGNYSSWLEQKRERLAREEKADLARERTLARELEWVQMAPRARQAKSKARLAAYDAMLNKSFETSASALEIAIPPGPRLGDVVVEADDVRKSYGDRVLM